MHLNKKRLTPNQFFLIYVGYTFNFSSFSHAIILSWENGNPPWHSHSLEHVRGSLMRATQTSSMNYLQPQDPNPRSKYISGLSPNWGLLKISDPFGDSSMLHNSYTHWNACLN